MIIRSDNIIRKDRPKLTLDAVVKNDMIKLNLVEHLVIDRAQWHKKIHVTNQWRTQGVGRRHGPPNI